MKHIDLDEIKRLILEVLIAIGVDEEVSNDTAEGLVEASLRGVDSHGIRLLFHYVEAVRSGRLNPNPSYDFIQTSPSTGILDADHTFGHAAGIKAMHHAIELAKKSGSGHVAVKNSSHSGAMAYFAHEACKQDMIGVAYTHATSRLRTPNGRTSFFGNNPMCFTAPMQDEEPFCYDGANSTITFNEVRRYGEIGKMLPEGVVADSNGIATCDPGEAEQLIPIGDYKGFGLSMVVDIFCGLLTGMPVGKDVSKMFGDEEVMRQKRELGQFYSAYRIDSFVPKEQFKARMQTLVDSLRSEPSIDAENLVMAPGDPEKRVKKERLKTGIPIPEADYLRFNEMADKYAVKGI